MKALMIDQLNMEVADLKQEVIRAVSEKETKLNENQNAFQREKEALEAKLAEQELGFRVERISMEARAKQAVAESRETAEGSMRSLLREQAEIQEVRLLD